MHKMLVADGVGNQGKAGIGPTWWVNHYFLPDDAIFMSDGKPMQLGYDHTALCNQSYSALNGPMEHRPDCPECTRIAQALGVTTTEDLMLRK